MAFTKINAAGIGTTETVTVDGLTVINDGSFGGNLTVSGVLTYEDVTNVDSVGLITARNGIVVGSGITLSKDGDIFATGVTTSTTFSGSGANLTNLPAANITGTLPAISGANLTGVLKNIVEDTSPQLGGNLDSNGSNIKLGDSSSSNDDRLQLGAATNGDLEIFHDGSSSYMDNATGDLYMRNSSGQILIRANTDCYISNYAANEHRAAFKNNGAVELYYDSSKKLETGTNGIVVTGQMYSNSAQIVGDAGGDAELKLFSDGGSQAADKVRIRQTHVGNSFLVESFANGGSYQSILKGTDARTIELHYQGTKMIETISTGTRMPDGKFARFGDGEDMAMGHNTYNYITYTGNELRITGDSTNGIRLMPKSDETAALFNPNGSVQLYHNSVEKLATFTEGVDVIVSGNAGLRVRGNVADVNPRIVFRRKNNDGNNSEPAAIQMTYQAGSTHESGHLDFLTNGDSGSAALSVKVRFQNDGVKYFDSTFSSTANNARKSYFTGTGQLIIGRNAHESYLVFQDVSNNTIGNIVRGAGSSVAYNTTSDYRLKENVVDLTDAITRLKTLSPKRFNFISDPSITLDGFIAHEVTAVPEAVEGEKDAVVTQAMIDSQEVEQKSVGDPIYQGIDQSKLVPLLTAALQEAITKIETLETKVAALEG